ncbi:MAG: HAMP domain-containing sensor histidine kinase [Hyphomonadaceae bacterium]|nr:HAMP domain-containing sensor histidine kinase [Hyphomonadaceae bacterium]
MAELESVIWIAVATTATASTGGAGSPAMILFAAGVATAWMSGGTRLTAEVAGFSLLGLALGSIASAGGTWIDRQDAHSLASAFGVAGLAFVGAVAAIEVASRPKMVSAAELNGPLKPVAGGNPDPETTLKIKQLETKARKAEAEAAEANARLDARTTFFAQTSHELRTPLNAIVGFAEMMRNSVFGPLPDKYQEYAGLIHEGGRNLTLIVDDVLDLARLEAGKYEIYRDLISLTDLAAEAVHFMRDEAIRKGVALELANGGDVEAFADSKAVRQIALNLVSNGLKFTPSGGTVTVAALDTRGGALLAVSDTGAGISPEELTRLSRAFEQGEAGKKQKGAGLGLSVVRAFAELHGGRLDIESREGGGSTIAVFFPAEEAGDPT